MKDRIRQIRKQNKMSQKEFAEKLHVSKNTITSYECGTRNPNASIVAEICRVFDIDHDWLMTGKGTPEKKVIKNKDIASVAVVLAKYPPDSVRYKSIMKFYNLIKDMSDEELEMVSDVLDKFSGLFK